jgi:3-phosphoshikimate 1-carboxyvinyltransferase
MTTSTARVPGSKSLTNRALAIAAMADGTSELRRPLLSDDTRAFAEALTAMGIAVDRGDGRWTVAGKGGRPAGCRVWCEDAGTAARFLPPLETADGHRGLPFRLVARGLSGGELVLPSGTSSQFLSGVMMAAPLMAAPLTVTSPELVSRPYVDMTMGLMRTFGVEVSEPEPNTFVVRPGGYQPCVYDVEPDASTASYFFAAAAVTGRSITVEGLGSGSSQGDLGFVDGLLRAGARVDVTDRSTTVVGTGPLRGGFTVDMGVISDTFMTLAAIAPLADAPIRITGVAHARLKESDRIAAMAENLERCGVPVLTGPDWIEISPAEPRPALISCRRDHRIAMSFSVLGLRAPGVELDDPACVSKTFPGFHAELARLFGEPA